MSGLNQSIEDKLKGYQPDLIELATEALRLSEEGLPEASIAEALEGIVRRIVKQREAGN